MEEDLHVQFVILLKKALHWGTTLTSDPIILDVLAEVLAKALSDVFAKFRVHWQQEHTLTLEHLGNRDRLENKRVQIFPTTEDSLSRIVPLAFIDLHDPVRFTLTQVFVDLLFAFAACCAEDAER